MWQADLDQLSSQCRALRQLVELYSLKVCAQLREQLLGAPGKRAERPAKSDHAVLADQCFQLLLCRLLIIVPSPANKESLFALQ